MIRVPVSTTQRALLVFPSLELGGAERQGLHVARFLRAKGWEVNIWSTLGHEGAIADECKNLGIATAAHRFLWPCRRSSLVRDTWRLVWALRRLRPNVILSYCASPNVGCGLASRLAGVKACIWGQRDVQGLRGDRVERFAFRRASAVICNAEHEVEYLERMLGQTRVATHVIHNGLDLVPAKKTRGEWRRELQLPDGVPVGVMLANFRPEKDHATLLRAWTRLLEGVAEGAVRPCLVLAGAPHSTHGDVMRLAMQLGIADWVRLPGQVKDVTGLLQACTVGILSSHREGLSNAVLEYMACGLPVVATDLAGNREALGDGAGESVVAGEDVEGLADLLRTLLTDTGLRDVLGAKNRARASAEFSVERMCEATLRVIEACLG